MTFDQKLLSNFIHMQYIFSNKTKQKSNLNMN